MRAKYNCFRKDDFSLHRLCHFLIHHSQVITTELLPTNATHFSGLSLIHGGLLKCCKQRCPSDLSKHSLNGLNLFIGLSSSWVMSLFVCVSLTFKFSLKLQHLLLFEARSVEGSYCFEAKGVKKKSTRSNHSHNRNKTPYTNN